MPKLPKRRLGRTPIAKCWYLADQMDEISKHIRYANKPSDLSFPATEIRQLLRAIEVTQAKWLTQWLKPGPMDLWPKLYERYL